jgi:ABC-2 type transport system ATP-binding protein
MDGRDHSATSPSDTVVELADVWKVYRQRQRAADIGAALRGLWKAQVREIEALKGINLRVRAGEIVAYAGPNGAGKSTTVKLLSGLLAPDRGSVRVFGLDPVRERVRYVNRIGVVFGQRTELWWDQPLAASYEWKRVVWDIPLPRYERMVGLIKELLGLDEIFHSLARELSLGQRMRADLGMALLHEPAMLFLDEPTLGLDVLAKRDILRFIKQLNRERQVTVMMTSHDMSDLEELAGRVVMIHRGDIAFDGDFDQLRREVTDRRRLLIETDTAEAPTLEGATLLTSDGTRHEYVFDATHVRIAALLEQAGAQTQISDVETHRAPIDDVIADIYETWQRQGRASQPTPDVDRLAHSLTSVSP